jgi:hypothetical protein
MSDSAVNLGAGSPDFSGMSLDELMFGTNDPVEISRRTRPSYSETGEAYRFQDGQQMPFIDEEGYRVNLGSDARSRGTEGMFYEQSLPRSSPYEGLAEPLTRRATPDFSSRPAELYMQEGGNPAIEEAGIMSALEVIRKSGRKGSPSDKRNNAVGVSLLRKAGVNASLPEIAQMVDQRVFDQLDRILDRGERNYNG